MIPGFCRTNLDDYSFEKWPTKFVAVPQKGDYVEAESGKVLRVVGITHCETKGHDNKTPYVEIELNK
jgi:hypothetical protein